MPTDRRRFLANASGVMAAVAATNLIGAPNVIAQPQIRWRMSTAYPPALDRQQEAVQRWRRPSRR
jgi:TRAP-type mannitol/chloroaromatic compound transport system substrate-binding protein